MKKVLVILGPTATGKTDLGLFLAKRINGELVACDSRQIYRNLDIGTGKFPANEVKVIKHDRYWEMDGVKVWMYDVANPQTQYTVADYVEDAKGVIEDILSQNKLPIIVGGTGLYLKALLEGLPNLSVPVDKNLREDLKKLSKEELQKKLQGLSPKRWEGMNKSDRENPRRLLRSIEIILMNPYINKSQNILKKGAKYETLKIGLTAPRDELYRRVDLRILRRVEQGMIKEAKSLYKKGLSLERMKSLGLEYRSLARLLNKEIGKKELVEILKGEIHSFIRRQQTWFKKEKEVKWFDILDENLFSKVEKEVRLWYYQQI